MRMLFPVTIYNAEGKVKKVLSEKMLHERHWKLFLESKTLSFVTKNKKREMLKCLKEKLDREFPDIPVHHYQ